MGYRRQSNVVTGRHSVTTSYTELFVDKQILAGFGILAETVSLLLSIGHAAGADGTSITIPVGVPFVFDHGVVGPIFVKGSGTESASVWRS